MKILDFFKKRKEKIEIEEEVINFKDLDSWIEDKSLEFKNKKTEFHTLLKGCVSKLSQDIKQNTPSLKNIDWEKMKVEERIKHTVKENLINYESHLNDLIRELNNLEESKLNKEEIYSIFLAFEKRSTISYQKSTYLIGKEIEEINKSMSLFFKNIGKVHQEHKDFIGKMEVLSNINKNLKELHESSKPISKIKLEINQIGKRISLLENELKNKEKIFNEIKKEKEYMDWKQNMEKFQRRKETLNKEIQMLASIIDFKALARVWHENPKEMSTLTEYRSNFQLTFNKDKGEVLSRLINLLENKKDIHNAISSIKNLEKEIKDTNLENSPSLYLEKEIQKSKDEISSLQEKVPMENKKIDKLVLARTPIIDRITQNVNLFNPNIRITF